MVFGLPIVLGGAMVVATLWFMAVAGVLCAWACTAMTFAALSLGAAC
jgi:hypothetical protein